MDSLVVFLIEQGYADNYRSAEKILECISDEFYEELLESATQRLAQLNAEMRRAMQRGDTSKLASIAAEIKAAKAASSEEYRAKGSPQERRAPRTRGESPQVGTSGRKAAPDPREGMRNINVDREADRLIGSSVPKPSYLSPTVPAHMQAQQGGNQLWAAGRRGERRGITGQTRRERRSGVVGRYENPNRFD